MELAKVENDVIKNVILAASVAEAVSLFGGEWIDLSPLPGVGIGWSRDGGVWSPPTVVVAEIPVAVRQANALVVAQAITLRSSITDADLDGLSEEQFADIAYLYPDWVSTKAYALDEKLRYEGVLYKVVQAHTAQPNWTPDTVPALYTKYRDPAAGPQPWVQPTGAQDAYVMDDLVTHDNPNDGGAIWVYQSKLASNATEPGRDSTFDRWWLPVNAV